VDLTRSTKSSFALDGSGAIRAPKAAEQIADQLRGRIVRGELQEGTVLTFEGLIDEFGVSRPTIREAFRILETESLMNVRSGANGGAHITAPDLDVTARQLGATLQMRGTTVKDLYEARMMFEPLCARLLAARATPDDIAALRNSIREQRKLARDVGTEKGIAEWSGMTASFHGLIVERCGSSTMSVLATLLRDINVKHHQKSFIRGIRTRDPKSSFRATIRIYEEFVDRIEKHDEAGAEELWRSWMQRLTERLFSEERATEKVVDLFD